jgi:uncharacterized protein
MKAKKKLAGAKKIRARSVARSRRAVKFSATMASPRRRKPAIKTRPKTKRAIAKRKMAKRKVPARKSPPKLPPLLLEGDQSAPPPVSGPGEKFALGPAAPTQHFKPEPADLPEAYGTKRLFLTARDPHHLYANWDLTREQQLRCNARSADKHLILRVYADKPAGTPASEIHVHPESRHWFPYVERAATKYVAELGYYQAGPKWTTISTSNATVTPPDKLSPDSAVKFATIPAEQPLAKLLALAKAAGRGNVPLAVAVEELRRNGHPDLPAVAEPTVGALTPAQEQTLAEVLPDLPGRATAGSLEIPELIHQGHEVSSLGAVSSVSSPFGGLPGQKGFWFNVNAELILYGATEPDATVTIGGRVIPLRPDGSFSCRFALPDGEFDLPALAISADLTEGRAAELKFTRKTDSYGEVGAQPQDPALEPPNAGNP